MSFVGWPYAEGVRQLQPRVPTLGDWPMRQIINAEAVGQRLRRRRLGREVWNSKEQNLRNWRVATHNR
jgi:hypothetical protein